MTPDTTGSEFAVVCTVAPPSRDMLVTFVGISAGRRCDEFGRVFATPTVIWNRVQRDPLGDDYALVCGAVAEDVGLYIEARPGFMPEATEIAQVICEPLLEAGYDRIERRPAPPAP